MKKIVLFPVMLFAWLAFDNGASQADCSCWDSALMADHGAKCLGYQDGSTEDLVGCGVRCKKIGSGFPYIDPN